MQKLLKIIAVIVILIAVPKIIQRVMFHESKADIAKHMTNFVDKVNKDLPRKIDDITTLTKAEFDGSTYRVNYEMDRGIHIAQSKMEEFKVFAVKQICSSEMKMILDKNIVIEYLYSFNPDGRADQKMSIIIPTNSCK